MNGYYPTEELPIWKNKSETLAHALIEERSSNGGSFASPDTETMLRGLCGFDETITEALNRLANTEDNHE